MEIVSQAIKAHKENHIYQCRGKNMNQCSHDKMIRSLKLFEFEFEMQKVRQREILAANLINKRNQLINDASPEKSEFVKCLDEVFNMAINFVRIGA